MIKDATAARNILNADGSRSLENWKSSNDEDRAFCARAAVRDTAAAAETTVYLDAQVCRLWAVLCGIEVSSADDLFLRQKRQVVQEHKVREDRATHSTFLFASALREVVVRLFGLENGDVGKPAEDAIKTLSRWRNQVTHPKGVADTDVKSEGVLECIAGFQAVRRFSDELLKKVETAGYDILRRRYPQDPDEVGPTQQA